MKVQTSHQSKYFTQPDPDFSHKIFIGSATFASICATASLFFATGPLISLCSSAIGIQLGVLAKKRIVKYPFIRHLSRWLRHVETKIPHVYIVALVVCCIVSRVFPLQSMFCASLVGICIGYHV